MHSQLIINIVLKRPLLGKLFMFNPENGERLGCTASVIQSARDLQKGAFRESKLMENIAITKNWKINIICDHLMLSLGYNRKDGIRRIPAIIAQVLDAFYKNNAISDYGLHLDLKG
ncbi:hypothetical protein Glove_214g21 [Diversispora epigaea]|uniref:Uncharacterized protein n=1 Tax=Diversispora epigaea TaxID=1348612 RepID=A0A397IKC3_9GLOM|nr:hypothetical protein Glove_214g21 [Diversispora epigaea]